MQCGARVVPEGAYAVVRRSSRGLRVHSRHWVRCVRAWQGKFDYHAGQYAFMCIPELGMFQWHPFSMSSAPFEADCMLHIRVLGNWTKSLYVGARGRRGWGWRWCIVALTCATLSLTRAGTT